MASIAKSSASSLQLALPSTSAFVGLQERLASEADEAAKWAALEAAFARATPAHQAVRYDVKLGSLRALKAAVAELPTVRFFEAVIPAMINAALDVTRVFPGVADLPAPLRRGMNAAVELTQEQVACLLAHSFFGSLEPLPLPEVRRIGHRYDASDPAVICTVDGELVVPHFGDPSWWRVLQTSSSVGKERLKCLLAYWAAHARGALAPPGRIIRFERVCLSAAPASAGALDWDASVTPLAPASASLGRCEDVAGAAAIVDFANKDLHIASVIPSCTQEECLFNVFPELFVGLAFCETMADDEAIAVSGLRRTSDYSGYLDTFRWVPLSAAAEAAAAASCAAGGETVIAVDALVVESRKTEAAEWSLRREVGKFAAGLEALKRLRAAAAARNPASARTTQARQPLLVATGNWGCGVFGGDRGVKFLQQLLAATLVGGVALDFACVRDAEWKAAVESMHQLLARDLACTSRDLLRLLADYRSAVVAGRVDGGGGWGLHKYVMREARRIVLGRGSH